MKICHCLKTIIASSNIKFGQSKKIKLWVRTLVTIFPCPPILDGPTILNLIYSTECDIILK